MYENEEKLATNGEVNAESNDKINSDSNAELNAESGDEVKDETPKRLPRKIIFGSALVCLGISIMLYNFKLFDIKDARWFLPFVLVVIGLLRIWKKGFFNVLAQILIIGGLQMHLAFLGFNNILSLGLPILFIWVGILVIIKGFLPREGSPKYRSFSDFKPKLQQERQIDTDISLATTESENKEQIQ
jgi:predicted membrane protein